MSSFYCYFDNKNKSLNFGINNAEFCLTFDSKKSVQIFRKEVDSSFFSENKINNLKEYSEEIYCKNKEKEERKNINSRNSLKLYELINNILKCDNYLSNGNFMIFGDYYVERSNLPQDFFSIYFFDKYVLDLLSKEDLILLRDGLKRYLLDIINFRNDVVRKTLALQEKNKIKIHHCNGNPFFLEITKVDDDLKLRTYYIGQTHRVSLSFSSKDIYGQVLNHRMCLADFDENYLYFENHSPSAKKSEYRTKFDNIYLLNFKIEDFYNRLSKEEDIKGDTIADTFIRRFARLSDEIKLDFKTKSNTYLIFKYQDIIADNCFERNLYSDRLLEVIRNEAIPLISETIKRDY